MTTTTERILTASDAAALGALVSAAHRGERVARVDERYDAVTYGTVRAVVTAQGHRPGDDADVRDALLHVTTVQGFEQFWPIGQALAEVKRGSLTLSPTWWPR